MTLTEGVRLVAALVACTAATVQQSIPNQESCPSCVIRTQPVVRIGTADGPSALPFKPHHIAIDAKGRYWVLVTGQPIMVFGSDGQFQRSVGRIGDGPGEIRWPYRAAAAGNSMLVAEEDGLVTVFGPDFDYVRRFRLPMRVSEIAVLRWPGSVLVGGSYRSPQGIGFPLHLVDMSAESAVVDRSFGPDPDGELRPRWEWALDQRLGVPNGGTIWAADRYRYRLTSWTSDGELLDSIMRDPSWFSGLSPGAIGLPDKPPDPEMIGAIPDTTGHLWVFSHVPGPRWRAAWAERVERYGAPPPGASEVPGRMVPPSNELYSTMVEVLDLKSQRVVVRENIDKYIFGVLPGPRAIAYSEPGPDFYPAVDILSLEILDGRLHH